MLKSWWKVFKSVAAGAFGVQTEANRQHDFQQKSIIPFIIVGVIFVLLFISTLLVIVNNAVT
ncbi:DUF2970 domain-containing protein [Alteromonadaceae bacterium BrNp21-10]|nr:DUF2970 domain-containing protein [Alteromonadaceae bacterium BrNp21-10]